MSEEAPPLETEDVQIPTDDIPVEDEIPVPFYSTPTGIAAISILLAILLYVVYKSTTKTSKKKRGGGSYEDPNSVAGNDIEYLVSKIGPKSTPFDILFAIATTPENISTSLKQLEKIEELRQEKLEKIKKEENNSKKSNKIDFNFDDDNGGWANDDDDGENNDDDKETKALEERQKERDQAKGVTNIKLEGIDDKVIGQKWVESVLTSKKLWPPPSNVMPAHIAEQTFTYNGKSVKVMDHPAIKRNICMTMGRLNASLLNTHPDLLEAGSQNLTDMTYFRGSMEYRNKVGLLLEAILRIGISLKSYELTKTVIETVVMFKLGTMDVDETKIKIFQDAMEKQYGSKDGIPALECSKIDIETAGEDEIATNDTLTLGMTIERKHAEVFTKFKAAAAAKQGIPPQMALMQYREGWWMLVTTEKMIDDDKADINDTLEVNNISNLQKDNPVMHKLLSSNQSANDKDITSNFTITDRKDLLLCAWPMIIQNCAQAGGDVKMKIKAPSVPGKYKFNIKVKSQEFLGCDTEFVVIKDVVDLSTLPADKQKENRGVEEKKEEDKKDESANEEAKKEK